jgi:exopolyphosphatase/guanosine-5'-triphosphate,3'-diphosphate pyrophosphatase
VKRAREAAAQAETGPENSKNTTERLAALDVGTHAAKLLVMEVTRGDGGFELRPLARKGIVTRLGEGSRAGGRVPAISEAAAKRTALALAELARQARILGAGTLVAGGTGVLRQAGNGRTVARRLALSLGVPLPILGAESEAALAILGARAGTGQAPPIVGVDLGGGSTEVAALDAPGPEPGSSGVRLEVRSLDLGCLSLADRYLREAPLTPQAAADLEAALRLAVLPWVVEPAAGRPAPEWIAVGGTATALATMDLGLAVHDPDRVHGHRLTGDAIARLAGRLSGAESQGPGPVGWHRQPPEVLLAGALLLGHLLAIHAVPSIVLSSWGLRHGLLLGHLLARVDPTRRGSGSDPRRSGARARELAGAALPLQMMARREPRGKSR